MRRLVLWALLAVGAAAVLLGRPTVPGVQSPSAPRPRPRSAQTPPATPSESSGPASPLRNVFEYRDSPAPPAAALLPSLDSGPPPALSPPPAPSVRLVGLFRQRDRLRAALWIAGEVVVLAAGEEAEGYRLLSASEERGVRLRAPTGEELALPPPGE